VWLPSINRANLFLRFLAVICYQLLATLVGFVRRFDVLITVNPAFEKIIPILVLSVLRRKPMIFCVYDIYPDIGVRLGIFRHGAIVHMVGAMEEFCYAKSVFVQVLSEGHRKTLLARGVAELKLAVVRPWVDTDFIYPNARENPFFAEHNLDKSFVVMYAGNFGLTQGLELLVGTAAHLAMEPTIRFVLVGKGETQTALETLCRFAKLTNVQFIPSQPREKLPNMLASADVALVMLKKGFGMDSVPSKTYSILASGRPILAVVDRGSDTWELIQHADCGVCVQPGDHEALAQAILKLSLDKQECARLGANGRAYAMLHHSRNSACDRYQELLSSVGERGTRVAGRIDTQVGRGATPDRD
jgi:colanic acid biosynthesis glycosyl transferase WcaI